MMTTTRRRRGNGNKDCCATTPTTRRQTITSTTILLSGAATSSTTFRRWRAVLIGLSLLHHASTSVNATVTCPPGESGNFPSSDCTQFGWCDGTSSQAIGVQSCAPGTLFNGGWCDWASNVDCGATPSPTPPPTTKPPTMKPTFGPPTTPLPTRMPVTRSPSVSLTALAVESVLDQAKDDIDNSLFLYQTPSQQWEPSSVYRYSGFLSGLRVMHEEGVSGLYFYVGDDSSKGHEYGLVNIAAFLAQSMKETIKYDACDENSWDLVNGKYPLSNACGQLGQSYQDYHCSPEEAHMECPVDPNMSITAVTNAKWYGAPGPLQCGPKSELGQHTGHWDYNYECNRPWADPPELCTVYEGQKAGRANNDAPYANVAGRTDVEGCCWWGRGVIQTTGICNFGKLNYFLGKRAADEGRPSRYPSIDFCADPEVICSSQEHQELKWIAGFFYWVSSVQTYNERGWDYLTELHKFVDGGRNDMSFIDAVSGIVNRGCHDPPCGTGPLDGGPERKDNFRKVMTEFFKHSVDVVGPTTPTTTPKTTPNTPPPTAKPTAKPTKVATKAPTAKPTAKPTKAPTAKPTKAPTNAPTKKPTTTPTLSPVSSGGRPANYCECVPLGTTTGSYIKCCSDQGTCNSPGEILCPAPQACLADYYIDFSVDDPFDLCQLQEEEVTPTAKPTKAPTAEPSKAPTVNPTKAPTQSPILVGDPTASPVVTKVPTAGPTSKPTLNNPPTSTTGGGGSSGERKTIIGYYASWQWYDRNKLAAPENMDFTKVTRVNFAFFQTDVNGNIWGTDSWADPNLLFGPYNWNPQPGSPTYCSWDAPPAVKSCNSHYHEKGLISLVHAAGAEIYPSIGGWTLSDAFPPMAASPTARAHFATKCAELVQEYDFDGIDLDWEYPGFADHSGTPEDTVNFNLLLDEIRAKLDGLTAVTGKEYGLTAALPCGPHLIRNIDIDHVANVLSELNLMTYDFHGAFSETTGVNAPVYDQGWGDPEPGWSVHGCTQNWLDGGGSRSKINIGLPFYGRSFKSATELNQPHTGADMQAWHWDDGTPQYFNILDQLSSMTSVRHEPTRTQYAYFNDGSGLVSYDDERAICDKTEYAIDHELNGFIIWELSGDMLSDFSTPLLDTVNKKLADPNMACGPPGAPGMNPTSTPAPQNAPQTSAPPTKSPTAVSLTKTAPPSKSPTLPAASPTKTPTVSSISTSNEPTMSPVAVSVGGTSNVPTKSPTSSSTETTSNAPTRSPTVSSQGSTSPTARPTEEDGSGTNGGGFYNGQITYSCGDESNQNLAGAVELDIHYDYEVHTPTTIDLLDGLIDLKSSVLDDLAQRINCIRSSERRKMSANKGSHMAMVEDAVVGMSSKNADDPDQGVCSVNVELDVATTCTPMEGLVTVFLGAGSSPSTIAEVKNELLFHVRTGMSAGRYESDKVAKVIYIAEGNAGNSNRDPSVPGEIRSEEDDDSGGVSSVTLGVVAFVLAALLAAALAAYLFVKRKDRSKRNRIEEADIEQLPQKVGWNAPPPSNMLPKRDLSGTSFSSSTESRESDINADVFESSKVSSTSTETPGGASIFSSASSSSQPSTFTFSSSNFDDTIPKPKRRRSEGGTQSFVFKPPSPPIPSSASAAGTSEAPTEPSDEPQRTSTATERPTMPPSAPNDANPSFSFAANTTAATSKSPSAAIFVFGSGETTASSDAASPEATGIPATALKNGGLGEDGARSSDHISSLEALAYLASPSKKNSKSAREDFPSELDTLDGID